MSSPGTDKSEKGSAGRIEDTKLNQEMLHNTVPAA